MRHSIFDALASEIAQPIGMQDYVAPDGRYVTGASSVYPAYPIDMSARDLARFALLYLLTAPLTFGNIYNGQSNVLILVTLALVAFGMVMVYSATSASACFFSAL